MNTDTEIQYKHISCDKALTILSNVVEPVGEFVRAFPGKSNIETFPRWLETWFSKRLEKIYQVGETTTIVMEGLKERMAAISGKSDIPSGMVVKLISIQPHYFRGFRDLTDPINLLGDLIVVDGRNSSGKTSLAEAFEWLLTGRLLRRSMQQSGDARELQCCIANQFKPNGEETWVNAVLITQDNRQFSLRRILRRDYGATQTSNPESCFLLDGRELSIKDEEAFLDSLFAGIPPILMQHSLRLFVNSTPSDRRNYFERLLQLDELTYLIERAVMGNARFSEFPSPTGSVAMKQWETLKRSIQSKDSISILRRAERSNSEGLQNSLKNALIQIGRFEFSGLLSDQNDLDQIGVVLSAIQKKERQKNFPLLENLRPKQMIDDLIESTFSPNYIKNAFIQLKSSFQKARTANQTISQIGEAQIVIARAIDELKKIGVVVETTDPQFCPFCDYKGLPTLTPDRLSLVQTWHPIQKAVEETEGEFVDKKNSLLSKVNTYRTIRNNLLPELPIEEEITSALTNVSDALKDLAQKCISDLSFGLKSTDNFDQACAEIRKILIKKELTNEEFETISDYINCLITDSDIVLKASRSYSSLFQDLDKSVGTKAREDPDYNLRELWLSVSEEINAIVSDIKWERSKVKVQTEIEQIREALILARKILLDHRRTDFSEGMTAIWNNLREDKYSAFSQLYIPEPRGRGFPVEIEVKAILDDSVNKIEVDALRVFSESQVNVLGIAAFATRSKMLGHKLMVLDDPVQSMDEEHFKTFSRKLLPELLSNDTQVIILTHNDTFAKELSYAWHEMDHYVTMEIQHSRRKGCVVKEGNRRVSERLDRAEELGEEGDLDRAWYWIRIAIERLYTVINIKYGSKDFNPLSWSNQTAEYMWDDGAGNGVGVIIEKMMPGSGKRLKEILSMSAAGAHDKSANGFTDLMNSISDLRKMLPKLRVGG